MTVKGLKKLIAKMPNDRYIVLAEYNGKETVNYWLNIACNTEHQEKINQLWLTKGIRTNI